MSTTITSIQRARELCELQFTRIIEPFVLNSQLCNQITAWMVDAESKQQYQREIEYLILRDTKGVDFALKYAANMPGTTWNTIVKKHTSLEIPKMKCPEGNEHFLQSMQITTFCAEQYQYTSNSSAPSANVTVDSGDIFLDCGGCYGDTALWALEKGAKVYSFEPIPESFQYLEQNLAGYSKDGRATAINAAISDTPGELKFSYANTRVAGAAAASPDGNLTVSATSLDVWCAAHSVIPDFIKMDIEGAEISALQGAQHTIRTHKPNLAVCLYHKVSDMWQIPFVIKQILPEYMLYCRKNHPLNEFVLYATVPSHTSRQAATK